MHNSYYCVNDSIHGIQILKVVYAVILLQLPLYAFSQSVDEPRKKITFQGIASGGMSRFKVYELPDSPDYLSGEAFVGLRVNKPLGGIFSLMSGLSLGYKFKRESYFHGPPSGPYTYEPLVVPELDDSASKKGCGYLGMPLALVINLTKRVNVYGGVQGRFWIPRHHDDLDILTGQTEVGFIGGGYYRISSRITMGVELFYGLKDLSYGAIALPSSGQFVDLRVTNQNLMITVTHSLWAKK